MNWLRYKRFFIVIIAIWLALVLIGLIFSRSVQGKVIEILSNQANKYLLSEIHIQKSDIHFSVFKKFPHASLELRNATIKLPDGFNSQQSILIKGDTLLFASKVYLQLNIRSIFTQKYQIEKIKVHKGYIQILSDKQNNSSLNILVKTEKTDGPGIVAQIDEFSCSELNIFTSDISNKSKTHYYIRKGNLSGTFEPQKFEVDIKAHGKIKRFEGKGQVLDLQQSFSIDAKFKKNKVSYIVDRGYFNFGKIPFKVIGSIRRGENTLVDLIFSAREVSVKQMDKALLRGLLGENGFQPKSGVLNIQATFIGYTKHTLPAIKAKFSLIDGKLYDKLHNITLTNVYMAGNGDNGKEHLPRSTTIRLDTFSFRTTESHQWGKLKIQNLVEPRISLALNGQLDIDDLQAVVHLSNLSLNQGRIINNAVLSGRIDKAGEKGKSVIRDVKVKGKFILENLEVLMTKYSFPPVVLDGKVELVNNNTLRFNELKAKSQTSDISISGILSNFNKHPGMPDFKGSVHASNLSIDDFFTLSEKRTGKNKPIFFPDSLRITGNLSVGRFSFGNFKATNYQSNIFYHNKTLNTSAVNMNGFEGNLKGILTLQQKLSGNIALFAETHLKHINIRKLFKSCNNFSQNVILAEHVGGYLSGPIEFTAEWSNTMDFSPESVKALGQLQIKNGILENYDPLMGLSNFINVEELKSITFDELNTSISIRNSKVFLAQTRIASSAITFDGSGMHGFDNKYEYRLQLGLSDILLGKARKKDKNIDKFGYVVDDGVGHTMLPLILSGKGNTFDVKYDKRKARETFKVKVQEEKEELKELFRKKSKDAEEAIDDQEFKLEEENNKQDNGSVIENKDSDSQETIPDYGSIEWDDSEDEE